MIRFLKYKNIFSSINKSPLTPLSRVYNVTRKNDNIKNSLQRDKNTIDKVIEENGSIYEKVSKQDSESLDNYYRYRYTIKMLQRENQELQRENEILNEERNDLINKNNELREFLKQKFN